MGFCAAYLHSWGGFSSSAHLRMREHCALLRTTATCRGRQGLCPRTPARAFRIRFCATHPHSWSGFSSSAHLRMREHCALLRTAEPYGKDGRGFAPAPPAGNLLRCSIVALSLRSTARFAPRLRLAVSATGRAPLRRPAPPTFGFHLCPALPFAIPFLPLFFPFSALLSAKLLVPQH